MSVGMAMRLYLASPPPLRSVLGNYDNCCLATSFFPSCHALRPCLATRRAGGNHGDEVSATLPVGGASDRATPTGKKRVVFADACGLALTDVVVFREEEEEEEEDSPVRLQFGLPDVEGLFVLLCVLAGPEPRGRGGLVLDFHPPSEDYLDLRRRLKAQQVSLENCSLQEGALCGTVKVQNVSFEKSVSLRITFDRWSSFREVPCQYLSNVYGCPDNDTFSFSLPLPGAGESAQQVEFCVCYRAQGQIFWDNNHGYNYCLVPAEPGRKTGRTEDRTEEEPGGGRYAECDRFGSPRTSTGIFPEWQSSGWVENAAPYW
ncbi:hypothetical protein NHX12_025177 [Muraenolepis orangiensis]|uniref:Protein phosphatase 1 regulatory subunit n=1 Tax=Muraenolepis orangiensis TaxID=630683 RepID=A0A9Q0IPE6_9TELE|nr:hypothetical protein NHX12_025177 [Muraenolepis orangiensis]